MTTAAPKTPSRLFRYLGNWLFIVAFAGIASRSLGAQHFGPDKATAIFQAIATAFLGCLLYPGWDAVPERRGLAAWSVAVALAATLAAIGGCKFGAIGLLSVKLAAGVFLLVLSLHSLCFALITLAGHRRHIPWLTLWAALAPTTLPLWAAPWAERLAAAPASLDAVLWCSPLSYLAGLLDYDVLRSQWFYRHTPYGMFRFEYPDPFIYSIVLIAFSLLLCNINFLRLFTSAPQGETRQ